MLTVGVAVGLVVGAGCSGDDSGSAPTRPTGRDDIVVQLGDGKMPTLLISGDGTVYEQSTAAPRRGAASGRLGIAPAPASPAPMIVRQLTEAGLDRVFERADELGLLDPPPEYASVDVTDSSSTYLLLRDDDGTYEHSAYALGYVDEEVDDERQALLDMVHDLTDLDGLVGRDEIGRSQPYMPTTYSVSTDKAFTEDGQRWPAGVPLEEGCVELPFDRFPDGVSGTYLYPGDDGDALRVWVVPDLPGDDC